MFDTKRKLRANLGKRDALLLSREQRIAQLESKIEQGERVVRDREQTVYERDCTIASLERRLEHLAAVGPDNELRAEIEQRGALVRQREARIRALEMELQGRDAELDLLRAAVDQAEDALRKRGATIALLGQPDPAASPARAVAASEWPSSAAGAPAPVIREWQKYAVEFAKIPLSGGQELIDPYVLEKNHHGHPTRLLIATRQAARWYDRFDLTEGPHVEALGMVREGGTVFDCGSHHGVNSLMYSDLVGPSGRVLAFDPYPMNSRIAKFNALLNSRFNISFIESAVGSKSGVLEASAAEQCVMLRNSEANDILSLQITTLDRFAAWRPDFIKMDIEGAEIDALAGASEILDRQPCLYIEMHPNLLPTFNRNAMDIFQFINLDHYRCFVNYPGKAALLPYEREFDLEQPCALFFVPKSQPPMRRYYTTAKAYSRQPPATDPKSALPG